MHEVNLEKMLDELLTQLINRLKRLVKIIRLEQKAIIHSDIKTIEDVLSKKANLKNDISLLEKNRLAILPLLAKKYKVHKRKIVLSDLINVMEGEQKNIYIEKRKELKKLFNKISLLHLANDRLIKSSISFQERSFMMIFNHLQNKSGYASTGKIEHSGKRLFNGLA